jgi:tetratricopeptide (TPR) repeat protein
MIVSSSDSRKSTDTENTPLWRRITGTDTAASKPKSAAPKQTEAQLRDAQINDLIQKGDIQEALGYAREWARVSYNSVADERRYHRVLLLDDPASGRLADHSKRYLPMLLEQNHVIEALEAFLNILAKLPDFAPQEPATTLALAEQAWKSMDYMAVVSLMRGFDRRYPGAQEIPKAYELAVRALKQGLDRGDKAIPIYEALKRRFPNHPSTQEASWVLREELGEQSR